MTKKRAIITLGSMIASAAPVATAVSCSTTWTSWSKNDDPQTKVVFKGSDIIAKSKYQVRSDTELMAAWDVHTKTLNIEMINNQFELVRAFSNIISIVSSDSIDSYWNDLTKMKRYLSSINKKVDINLSYRGKTMTINWDVTTIVANAIKGIDDYNLLATDADKNSAKAFNVEARGLSANTPVDFGQVANVGSPLTSNPTVSELMKFDISFALALSKLVNLPLKTFTEFTNLLTQIDNSLNTLWSFLLGITYIEDAGLDFSIGITGKIGTYDIEEKYKDKVKTYESLGLPIPGEDVRLKSINEFKKGYLKAQFIIQALKH